MLWRTSRVLLGLPIAFALTAFGCDVKGLVDVGDSLLDPDRALIDRPGRRLVEGRYSGLKIAGSAENGGYVLARRHDVDVESVALVPFLKGTGCEYGPAFSYDRFSSRIDIELSGTIAVQVDENPNNPAFGTVRFIDYECKEVIDEVPDTVLPGPLFPGVEPFGMLTRNSEGALYLIDAKNRESKLVTPFVDYGVVAGTLLYTLESGQVVVRNEELEVIAELGSGVVALVATGGDRLSLAYQDETGMHAWSQEEEETTSLGEEGCFPWFVGTDAVAYHDPCDERRLAIHAPSDYVFGVDESDAMVTLRGPANSSLPSLMIRPIVAEAPASLSEVTIVTTDDAATKSGDLLALTVPEEASSDELEVQMQAISLAPRVTYAPERGVYFRDYVDGRGTLLDFERTNEGRVSGVIELLDEVAWVPFASPYSYRGVLANYDGKTGNLVRLTRTGDGPVERETLGKDVPMQTFAGDYETEMVAYVSEVNEDGLGVLTIVDEFGPYQVADDVLIDEIESLDDPNGVVFLSPSKQKGAFELHAWLIEAELDLTIHNAVSEYLSIPWPSPGVLYSVPEGDDAGLWFAKAR